MRRILQALAEARSGKAAYVGAGGWGLLKADLSTLKIEPPGKLWDLWRAQGAIFLNAGLTITLFVAAGLLVLGAVTGWWWPLYDGGNLDRSVATGWVWPLVRRAQRAA